MKKIQVKATHGGKLVKNLDTDSGFDVIIAGYRDVVNDELMKPVWFDENLHLKNRVGLAPNETILFLTGIQLRLYEPEKVFDEEGILIGYNTLEAQMRGRSGLSLKKNTNVKFGSIDNEYTGDCGVIFHNNGHKTIVFDQGERVGQIVFNTVYTPTMAGLEFVEEIDSTDRGSNGFGSSDAK